MAIYTRLNSDEIKSLNLNALPADVVERNGSFSRFIFGGCVFSHFSRYMGDGDSAYYASVWNEAEQTVQQYCYDWGYCSSDVEDDATPEAWNKAKAFIFDKVVETIRDRCKRESEEIKKGKTVRIVAGRKYPKGTLAIVKFTGKSDYGFYARLTFQDGSEGFIDERNIVVEQPERYIPSEDWILEEAERTWKNSVEIH